MGTRKQQERQADLWVATDAIAEPPGHAFYTKLNEILTAHRFDVHVEQLCQRFYHGPLGRPSLPAGVYFRCLLIGYFEGLDGERAIAWRVADSLSLRQFLGYGSDTGSIRRRRTIRRFPAPGACSGCRRIRPCSIGSCGA